MRTTTRDKTRSFVLPSGRDRTPHRYRCGVLSAEQVKALEVLAVDPAFAYVVTAQGDTLMTRPGPVVVPWVDSAGRVNVIRVERDGATTNRVAGPALA